MVDQPLPVISYARISSDTEKDEHGVEDQHRTNAGTARRLGWSVVAEITDNDLSAAKAGVTRDGFEAMVRALRAGRLPDGGAVRGAVVVADDRLVRRAGDYERFVDALTYDDGRVYADARGPKNLYSEDVEAMGLFGVVISKIEVRKIQRRLRDNHRSRAERGVPVGGTRPFGWNEDKRTLNEAEAPYVRQAIRDLPQGKSLTAICAEWRAAGLRTSLGNEWTLRSLKLTLWNPRVCGWRNYRGEILRDEEGAPVVGQWETIVTPAEWEAVDAVFQARRGRSVGTGQEIGDVLPENHSQARHLLTGVLRCGRVHDGEMCGTALRVSRHKDCKSHLYVCPSKAAGGCGGLGRRGDLVEEYVTEAVLARLEERQARAASAEPWDGEERLARLVAKRSRLSEEWQNDAISDDVYFPGVKKIEAQLKELRAERHRRQAMAARAGETEDVRKRWKGLHVSQRRALIFEALHAVIVHPAGKGRKPFNPDLLVPVWKEE
ncbi:recombinase family protein [Streptomyces sedi]|uniref:Recombinase family protein n=1 Tax=Streptomyces sedi TaxID=555059 RepID=A0A5C4V9Y9_9ACTN|nr:recombinase family protein [Streptomyces sedi]